MARARERAFMGVDSDGQRQRAASVRVADICAKAFPAEADTGSAEEMRQTHGI